MRGPKRPTPLLILAAALAAVTCAFPTDKSDKVFVTLEAPSLVVLRGQDMSVYAQAWRVVGADTQAIGNVDFMFQTGSSSIARVQKDGGGYATVTGVNSGTVDITARAVAFEQAGQADLVLRVSNPLEIDSVRPALAHHGEIITVYGVGVDSMFIASLADVNLIEYPFSRVRDLSTGLGQISFWVPPPARSAPLFYLGAGVFGFDSTMTNVLFRDVFEPNDTVATNIPLDVAGPWPGTLLAPIIFTNPALAFEPVERSTSGEDWYRFFTNDTSKAVTFFIQYPSLAGDTSGTRIFLIDSLYYDANGDPTKDPIEKFIGRDSADFIGSLFYRCKGFSFAPPMTSRESTTIALRNLPSHAVHLLTNFTRAQRYGLTAAQGYFTADPQIKQDAYEENDMCHYADAGNRRIPLTVAAPAFSDTLTIDNPHEIDWLRLDLAGSGSVGVTFRTASRPFPGNPRDTSDIDLYVMTAPNPATATGLNVLAIDTTAGSASTITIALTAPASYYIAIQDFAGVPTRYAFCMARGIIPTCTPVAPVAPLGEGTAVPLRPRRAGSRTLPIVEPNPPSRSLVGRKRIP
jgi:hypothetical protein